MMTPFRCRACARLTSLGLSFLAVFGSHSYERIERVTAVRPPSAGPVVKFSINRADTGRVAAWPTKGQVYFARLGRDGTVLPPGEIKTPGTAGMRTGLLALSVSDGATLVAWKNKD